MLTVRKWSLLISQIKMAEIFFFKCLNVILKLLISLKLLDGFSCIKDQQLNEETSNSFRIFSFWWIWDINLSGGMTEISIKPVFLHVLTGCCAPAGAESKEGKKKEGFIILHWSSAQKS